MGRAEDMENPPILMAPGYPSIHMALGHHQGHLAELRVEAEEKETNLTRTRATVGGTEEEALLGKTNKRVSTKIA